MPTPFFSIPILLPSFRAYYSFNRSLFCPFLAFQHPLPSLLPSFLLFYNPLVSPDLFSSFLAFQYPLLLYSHPSSFVYSSLPSNTNFFSSFSRIPTPSSFSVPIPLPSFTALLFQLLSFCPFLASQHLVIPRPPSLPLVFLTFRSVLDFLVFHASVSCPGDLFFLSSLPTHKMSSLSTVLLPL